MGATVGVALAVAVTVGVWSGGTWVGVEEPAEKGVTVTVGVGVSSGVPVRVGLGLQGGGVWLGNGLAVPVAVG